MKRPVLLFDLFSVSVPSVLMFFPHLSSLILSSRLEPASFHIVLHLFLSLSCCASPLQSSPIVASNVCAFSFTSFIAASSSLLLLCP